MLALPLGLVVVGDHDCDRRYQRQRLHGFRLHALEEEVTHADNETNTQSSIKMAHLHECYYVEAEHLQYLAVQPEY